MSKCRHMYIYREAEGGVCGDCGELVDPNEPTSPDPRDERIASLERSLAEAKATVGSPDLDGDIITHPRSPWEMRHNAIIREVQSLREQGRDARRYQWLRSHARAVVDIINIGDDLAGASLDAAIDAALVSKGDMSTTHSHGNKS